LQAQKAQTLASKIKDDAKKEDAKEGLGAKTDGFAGPVYQGRPPSGVSGAVQEEVVYFKVSRPHDNMQSWLATLGLEDHAESMQAQGIHHQRLVKK
jgi:hypothetical protein